MLSIGIIGNGRMANSIATQLHNSNTPVSFIAARNWNEKGNFHPTIPKLTLGTNPLPDVDALLFCVSDAAISDLSRIYSASKINIHFAGSKPLNELKSSLPKAVIWPIQSITHKTENWNNVPLIIDTENDTHEYTKSIAQALNPQSITELPFDKRLELHVAAVFMSNFSNALLVCVEDLLKNDSTKIEMLLPLLHNTVFRYKVGEAFSNQTGPAIRNDLSTIQAHLSTLHNYPELAELYKNFTTFIQNKATK